jgi:glycosyltransferase involved in cell wall biosynthesis
MIKLIELNYHCHTEFDVPEQAIEKHALSSGFIHFIKDRVDLLLVKHLNYNGRGIFDSIRYAFFKSRNKFWYIPFATHRFIKKEKPDVIVVQGFVFVLQLMALRWAIGKRCIILVQHHGEKPFTGIKGFLQRKADAAIDGYLFTSLGNATIWLDKKVIAHRNKCFEILSASTNFSVLDKDACKQITGIAGVNNFIWVARLNSNKDPLTVLHAFKKYLLVQPDATLYMIYQTAELLNEIKTFISSSPTLQSAIHLTGKIEHADLLYWYNAADFYISGSHSEGSGYALVEAMACGCIPVVTNIPSFSTITLNGQYGFLFEPGNSSALLDILLHLKNLDKNNLSASTALYSQSSLSYKAVADQFFDLASALISKKP